MAVALVGLAVAVLARFVFGLVAFQGDHGKEAAMEQVNVGTKKKAVIALGLAAALVGAALT